eukprot:783640-Pyramimonas_sp.AAC.1
MRTEVQRADRTVEAQGGARMPTTDILHARSKEPTWRARVQKRTGASPYQPQKNVASRRKRLL